MEKTMNETKFTPGPWHKVEGTNEVTALEGLKYICVASLFVPVGSTSEDLDSRREVMHANAHLIAAAPDLYAALDEILEALFYDDAEGIEGKIKAAYDALAQARGEAQ
jgi:hypothetical protein